MEWFVIALIVLVVLFIILVFPLFFQLRFYINALKNLGAISITLFGIIPLASFQIQLQKDAIKIIRHTRKNNEKEVKYFDAKSIFTGLLIKNLFLSVKINELSLFFSVGEKNNAFSSAYYGGVWYSVIYSLLQMLKERKGAFPSNIDTETNNDENKLKLSGYLGILIVPFQIVYCFALTIKQFIKVRRRYEKFKSI
ncbi:MAG: hypothetical protein IJZ26_02060 [Clostridia bacterium]|nr:hypothetical protein [Clostridia bacterium]